MLFNNPRIIKSSADIRIGGVDIETDVICYVNYCKEVRQRILKLVCDYVKFSQGEGGDKEMVLQSTLALVYSYLHVPDKSMIETEEGITDEIIASMEFQNWQTKIYYRFLETHYGVVNVETPIPVQLKSDIYLPQEVDEDEDETLWVILEGLIAANNE